MQLRDIKFKLIGKINVKINSLATFSLVCLTQFEASWNIQVCLFQR